MKKAFAGLTAMAACTATYAQLPLLDDFATPVTSEIAPGVSGILVVGTNPVGTTSVTVFDEPSRNADFTLPGFPPNAIGFREWNVNNPDLGQVTITLTDAASMSVSFNNTVGTGANISITYFDTIADLVPGPDVITGLDLDLTSGGGSAFAVDILDYDLLGVDPVELFITVEDSDSADTVAVDLLLQTAPFAEAIAFADFTGIDFTDVQFITIGFDADNANGADLVFNNFRVVPEPTTWGLILGSAALGFAFWRRRLRG
ncbi:MAG: PEP-CTERM sorting domain-containing protein [Opitutales bacterium]